MRLLVINFEMDPRSSVLAWQYRVVRTMAEHCERIVVLTQKAEACSLPENVGVYVIPRWYSRAPFRWIGAKWLANVAAFRLCKRFDFDACFIHMNMEWAYRLYPSFRWFDVPVLLWYAHGSVTWRLRLAHYCVDRVMTSSKEGFRLSSNKTHIIGQGIDTELFCPNDRPATTGDIVVVGRISRRKRIDLMIQVMAEIKRLAPAAGIRLRLIGRPLTREDERYEAQVAQLIRELGLEDRMARLGHTPMDLLPAVYRSAFIQLNLSTTGSMDKTVLEGLACGCPVLTSNIAFAELFQREGLTILLVKDESPRAIAQQLLGLYQDRNRFDPSALRNVVLKEHDLQTYVVRILTHIREVVALRSVSASPMV